MKDSTVFKGFILLFALLACIAFWLWLFGQGWPLGVAALFFCVLLLVAIFFFRSSKKFNL